MSVVIAKGVLAKFSLEAESAPGDVSLSRHEAGDHFGVIPRTPFENNE